MHRYGRRNFLNGWRKRFNSRLWFVVYGLGLGGLQPLQPLQPLELIELVPTDVCRLEFVCVVPLIIPLYSFHRRIEIAEF